MASSRSARSAGAPKIYLWASLIAVLLLGAVSLYLFSRTSSYRQRHFALGNSDGKTPSSSAAAGASSYSHNSEDRRENSFRGTRDDMSIISRNGGGGLIDVQLTSSRGKVAAHLSGSFDDINSNLTNDESKHKYEHKSRKIIGQQKDEKILKDNRRKEQQQEEQHGSSWNWSQGISATERLRIMNSAEWDEGTDPLAHALTTSRCEIPRVHHADLSIEVFNRKYRFRQPVIITGQLTNNTVARRLFSKKRFLKKYRKTPVQIATGRKITIGEYYELFMAPTNTSVDGKNDYYYFGDAEYHLSHDIFFSITKYVEPPKKYIFPNHKWVYVVGMGGSGTGIPFHIHANTENFSELMHGRKRWFFIPAEKSKRYFNISDTAIRFITKIDEESRKADQIRECTTVPGEIMYVPGRWPHLVVNVGQAVSVNVVDVSPSNNVIVKKDDVA